MLVATISAGRRVFTEGQPPKVRPTKSRRSCSVAVDGMCTGNAPIKSTTMIVFRRRLRGETRHFFVLANCWQYGEAFFAGPPSGFRKSRFSD